jgi:hypothetical protein
VNENDAKVEGFAELCETHLNMIADALLPGMELCLVAWKPGEEGSEFIMCSSDFPEQAAKVLMKKAAGFEPSERRPGRKIQ